MQALALPQLRAFSGWSPLILRLAVGIVMAVHGWQKFSSGSDGWLGGGMLTGLGFPAPVAFAWLVMLVELVGGIFLILGLFSRLSGILITIVLLVAIITVKSKIGLIAGQGGGAGAELDLALAASALAVALLGPGGLSLDRMLGIDKEA